MSAINPASIKELEFAIVEEVTRGTTPASPVYDKIPVLPGSSFQSEINYTVSNVSTGNRMGGKVIPGTRASSGVINSPIINEPFYDKLMESTLTGAYGSYINTGAITGTFEADDDSFTRASGNFLTDTITARLRIGDLVAISGASTNATTLAEALDTSETEIDLTSAANFPTPASGTHETILVGSEWITYTGKSTNTLTGCVRGAFGSTAATALISAAVVPVKKITAITATKLTFADHPCVDETSVAITFKSRKKQLFAGTTRKYFTVQRNHTDLDLIRRFTGQEVNTASHTIPTSGETTCSFNFVGTSRAEGEAASSTYNSLAGNSPCSGSATGVQVLIDGAVPSTCFSTMQINMDNARAQKFGVGSRDACFVEQGDFTATVAATSYLVDETNETKYENGTYLELIVEVRDQTKGDGYRYIFPYAKFSKRTEGEDGNTSTEQFEITAEEDTTIGTKMIVEKLLGS